MENKPTHKNGVAAETTLIHFKNKAPRGNYDLIQPQPREISLPGVNYDLIWQQPLQTEAVKNPTVEILATSTGGKVFVDVVMMELKLYQFDKEKKMKKSKHWKT